MTPKNNRKLPRVAFVIPWYGPELPGGAETLCRAWAEKLHNSGEDVTILTTTIHEFQSNWNHDYHPAGETKVNGVPIHRFPVKRGNHQLFNEVNQRLLSHLPVTREEEEIFVSEGPNSDELNCFIKAHRSEYLYFFIPYLYGTTYHGLLAAGPKTSTLIPCLHDEPYARMAIFRNLLGSVGRFMFNSEPEKELARKLYGLENAEEIVLGMGLDTSIKGNAARFRKKYGVTSPFLLYVGRKDITKNVDLLVHYFTQYKEENPDSHLELLLVGRGSVETSHESIRDLGFIPNQDKCDAHAAAELLCNPSLNESFSIILMESWLLETPVLVHANSPVPRNYVEQSGGGIFFRDYYDFAASIDFLLSQPDILRKMAESGREFVQKSFSWDLLLRRFRNWVIEGFGEGRNPAD